MFSETILSKARARWINPRSVHLWQIGLFRKSCIFDEIGEGPSGVALHMTGTDIPQDVVVAGSRLLANDTAQTIFAESTSPPPRAQA